MHFKEIWKVNVDILKTLFSPLLTLFLLFLRVQVWRRYFNRTSRYLYTNRIKGAKQIVNMLGQISASFNTLQRSIDDYENLAKREMVPLKKETALT